MNFTPTAPIEPILIISFIIFVVELCVLNTLSSRRFEFKVIDNNFTMIMYSTYFLLPFTIKIKKYINIKEAYTRTRLMRSRYGSYNVYDLIVKFSKGSKVLFNGKSSEKDLLKYRKKINEAIASFEEYTINDHKSMSAKIIILFVMLFAPSAIFFPFINGSTNNQSDISYQIFFSAYLLATAVIITITLLSLLINHYTNIKSTEKQSSIPINNNKIKIIDTEDTNISSEATKIYDSLIK